MARTQLQKAPTVVTITKPWQLAFIAALVLSQLPWMLVIAWSYTRHGQYVSAGTWAWQITTWLYPLLLVLAGYVFARSRIRGLVPQLFWALFLANIGDMVSMAESTLSGWLRYSVFHVMNGNGSGWWTAFGWDWSQMAVTFVLFCLVLGWIARRKRA